ncbi:TlpA family protein disulfide reductase [Mucilaginibacter antarcticus]|uniref:TlpA family protein disulfide reductase n=1 Tax=Mucilaginibacter antarcticus TaxID=1855725 RepID=UPI003638AEB4
MKFDYKGKKYIAISQPRSYEPFYTIVPDRPYFTGLGKSKSVKNGQFVKIGDDTFGLSSVADNGNELTLIGDDIEGFRSDNTVNRTYIKSKPRNTDGVVSRQTGFKAPEIKGIDVNANAAKLNAAVSLAKLKGKYVFIDIWSTTCIPCIEEFPNIKKVYNLYKNKNFEIIGIVDERSPNATARLLKLHNVNWPNIIMGKSATQIKGYEDINSYPTTYLIDPTGKIIAIDLRAEALMNKLKTLLGV